MPALLFLRNFLKQITIVRVLKSKNGFKKFLRKTFRVLNFLSVSKKLFAQIGFFDARIGGKLF